MMMEKDDGNVSFYALLFTIATQVRHRFSFMYIFSVLQIMIAIDFTLLGIIQKAAKTLN
jgi:hypothetical protein